MICVHMWSVARVSSQAAGGKLGQSSTRDGDRLGMTALLYVRSSGPRPAPARYLDLDGKPQDGGEMSAARDVLLAHSKHARTGEQRPRGNLIDDAVGLRTHLLGEGDPAVRFIHGPWDDFVDV